LLLFKQNYMSILICVYFLIYDDSWRFCFIFWLVFSVYFWLGFMNLMLFFLSIFIGFLELSSSLFHYYYYFLILWSLNYYTRSLAYDFDEIWFVFRRGYLFYECLKKARKSRSWIIIYSCLCFNFIYVNFQSLSMETSKSLNSLLFKRLNSLLKVSF